MRRKFFIVFLISIVIHNYAFYLYAKDDNDKIDYENLNYEKVIDEANKNNPMFQYALGRIYFDGVYGEQNNKKAFKWYKKAAEANYTEAQYRLGVMFYKGIGIARNHKYAYKYFYKAAKSNHAEAQGYIGVMYALGEYVEKNLLSTYMFFYLAHKNGAKGIISKLKELESILTREEIHEARKAAVRWLDIQKLRKVADKIKTDLSKNKSH